MKLPEYLTTVTVFSRTLGLILFFILAFGTFLLGIEYQRAITPPKSPEVEKISPITNRSASTLSNSTNWKKYLNPQSGFEISYPPEWIVFGPNGDYDIEKRPNTCIINPLSTNTLILDNGEKLNVIEFSKEAPIHCNWVLGDQLPLASSEFSIATYSEPIKNIDKLFDNPVKVSISGIEAYKYDFIKKPVSPNIKSTRIYLNKNNKGYVLYLKQKDAQGNYDQTYDEVIKSIKFLE